MPSILWAIAGGRFGGSALAIFYRALASGHMGLTAPVAALLGAAIPTHGRYRSRRRSRAAGRSLGLLCRLRDLADHPSRAARESRTTRLAKDRASARPAGVGMAALAGVGFAGFYLCIHQASGSPALGRSHLAASDRLRPRRLRSLSPAHRSRLIVPVARSAALAGFLDISASALFIYASQHGRLDEAVVITSLYPAMTVLLARIILKEHFSRWKFVGLLAALAAVPMIAAG